MAYAGGVFGAGFAMTNFVTSPLTSAQRDGFLPRVALRLGPHDLLATVATAPLPVQAR